MTTTKALKFNIVKILKLQGYKVKPNGFFLKNDERDTKRQAHYIAKAERMLDNESLVIDQSDFVKQFMVDGKELDVTKIDPVLVEVKPGTKWETLFRWWNLVWWSLPYEKSYGRQMRFVLWDKYHKAPMGLIGLQSPILSWSVRDNYLGIGPTDRDFWVNQSLNAQRLGALPPYNNLLGGKLVAAMMSSDYVRRKFKEKYSNIKTLMKDRSIPADLLFITTTGAYGKSCVYSRFKMNGIEMAKFLGYTNGTGSFHIPNFLYEDLILYLKKLDYDVQRGYGNGPSRKVRLIDQALTLLGFKNGINHSIKRSVYLFPFAKNINAVINKGEKPQWNKRSQKQVADFWKQRWAIPRAEKDKRYQEFSKEKFIEQTFLELKEYKKIYKKLKSL
jgi:hypothetical protein